METQGTDERWREIRSIHKEYRFFYEMAVGVALVVVGIVVGFALFPEDTGYRSNLYTTILGVVITIAVLDLRAEHREQERFKADLIHQMRSRVRDEAVHAVEELSRHRWLHDGTLCGQLLVKANLEGSDLRFADLRGTHLVRANLRDTDLLFADLRGAYLYHADLQGATLEIPGWGEAKLDEATMLPDESHWKPDTDMRRFTDPTHPEFWRSDDPSSPAYRGKREE